MEEIFGLLVQYGPALETGISNLVKEIESGKTLTLADVQAEFAPLKPYSAYGIAKAFTPPTATPAAQ